MENLKRKCKICGYEVNLNSSKSKQTRDFKRHLKHEHGLTYKEYVIQEYYNGIVPECKCGCGTKMKFDSRYNPPFNEYATNHFPRKPHTNETKQKISKRTRKAFQEKYGVDNVFQLDSVKEKIKSIKYSEGRVQCKICNKNFSVKGFNGHISSHGLSIEDYVTKYGEYRKGKIKNKKRLESNSVSCLIDGYQCLSEQHLSHYVKKVYGLTKSEYVRGYIFHNIPQLCKCGCGKEVKILSKPPYRRDFISGHNPNGMTGKRHTLNAKYKMSQKAIQRELSVNKKNTGIEIEFERKLKKLQLKYTKQLETKFGIIDFYVNGYHIEVDGEYWHPLELRNLNFQLIQSSINDFKKNRNIKNLIRIRGSEVYNEFQSFDDIIKCDSKHSYPYSISNYREPIIRKEYFKHLIETKGKLYLKKYTHLLLKFIRTFQPNLPTFTHHETLECVLKTVPTKVDNIHNDDIFNNNCSTSGVGYLKSNFKSYWKSKFKGNKTPEEIWNNDKMMLKIIEYRIGLNNSGEVFDFSLHQLIRGISAIRGTVSFFKPVLAAAIYNHYITNTDTPIVLDPCAGFGGRLLGFKSVFPNGKYIGCEPNFETYNELVKLAGNFENVEIYNCKFEDFKKYDKYDLVFTSIPYYDLEIYSNPIDYKNIEEWRNTFIQEFFKYDNVYINIPEDLYEYFNDCTISKYIQHNSTHLTKLNKKKELIIKL